MREASGSSVPLDISSRAEYPDQSMGMMKLVISVTGKLTQLKTKRAPMVYDTLNKLLQSDSLRDKTLVFSDKTIVTGGSIFEVNRSHVSFRGGESNCEEFSLPIEKIAEIRQNENVVFKRKKRIEKIYPRG